MTTTSSGFDSTSEMLSRETSRKICSVFSQMSSLLLSENSTLKARLERLEAELQSVTENAEDARRWREDVLSGCPVLFQQSGLLFSLKPSGRLTRRTAAQRRDEESSSAAQMDRLDEEPADESNTFSFTLAENPKESHEEATPTSPLQAVHHHLKDEAVGEDGAGAVGVLLLLLLFAGAVLSSSVRRRRKVEQHQVEVLQHRLAQRRQLRLQQTSDTKRRRSNVWFYPEKPSIRTKDKRHN